MHHLVALLQKLEQNDTPENLEQFAHSRREDKRITQELTEQLSKTFVTPLEREDIQELAAALYKIPKTVEKIGERILICPEDLAGQSFGKQVELLDQAAEMVLAMVKQLRQGINARTAREMNAKLQGIEGEADKLELERLRDLFKGGSRREADYFSPRPLRALGKSDRSLPRRREHHPTGGAEVFVATSHRVLTLIMVILAAVIFEYSNGFHDAANAIATVVSTKVLTPRQAIAMAAFFNLTGALFGGAVASTIGKGLVDTKVVTMTTVLCRCGSCVQLEHCHLVVWLTSSSSHALIGGLCGAALATARGDWSVIKWNAGIWPKVVAAYDHVANCWLHFRRALHVFVAYRTASLHAALRSISYLENCKSSALPGWRIAMAQTTHRKRWASSLWRCLPEQKLAASIIGRAGSIF